MGDRRGQQAPKLVTLREKLIVVVRGYEKRGRAGDEASAATARALREVMVADRESRPGKPEPTTTCSACGQLVRVSADRPGGTANHHHKGAPCPGQKLPFAAHDELRLQEPNVYLLVPANERQAWSA